MEMNVNNLEQVSGGAVPFIEYRIQEGDTIGSIAAKFGINANSLYVHNTDFIDNNPDQLPIGHKLIIPKK